MYAIVDIAGQQIKVEKDRKVFVHRLKGDENSKVVFDNVLLIGNNGKTSIGEPYITGASVSATILEHCKSDKIIVFKKKRRKGYKKTHGHRQYLTKILIENIAEKGSKTKATTEKVTKTAEKAIPKAAAKKEPVAKVADKKKTTVKKAAKPAAASAKKPAAKKIAAKKAEPKKTTAKKKD